MANTLLLHMLSTLHSLFMRSCRFPCCRFPFLHLLSRDGQTASEFVSWREPAPARTDELCWSRFISGTVRYSHIASQSRVKKKNQRCDVLGYHPGQVPGALTLESSIALPFPVKDDSVAVTCSDVSFVDDFALLVASPSLADLLDTFRTCR